MFPSIWVCFIGKDCSIFHNLYKTNSKSSTCCGNWVGMEGKFCYREVPHVFTSCTRRIIECFGLEGTFRGHLVQPPCNEQGHLQPDQVAQSPVQPGLECFQGWGIDHLSEFLFMW